MLMEALGQLDLQLLMSISLLGAALATPLFNQTSFQFLTVCVKVVRMSG
jgi:hypothetical protein